MRQWVAVASAGPYASLHLAPDRQPHQRPTTQFLQAGCPSCRPTNSVKALKAITIVDTGVKVKQKSHWTANITDYFEMFYFYSVTPNWKLPTSLKQHKTFQGKLYFGILAVRWLYCFLFTSLPTIVLLDSLILDNLFCLMVPSRKHRHAW